MEKFYGGIGVDEIEKSVKRRGNSISYGTSAFCTGRVLEKTIFFRILGTETISVDFPLMSVLMM